METFIRLLDETWVRATARYEQEVREVQGVAAPPQPKQGDPPPTEEEMKMLMVGYVKDTLFKDATMEAIFQDLPQAALSPTQASRSR